MPPTLLRAPKPQVPSRRGTSSVTNFFCYKKKLPSTLCSTSFRPGQGGVATAFTLHLSVALSPLVWAHSTMMPGRPQISARRAATQLQSSPVWLLLVCLLSGFCWCAYYLASVGVPTTPSLRRNHPQFGSWRPPGRAPMLSRCQLSGLARPREDENALHVLP